MSKFEENRGVPWLVRDWKQGKKKKKNNKGSFGLISLLGLGFRLAQQKRRKKNIKGSVWFVKWV